MFRTASFLIVLCISACTTPSQKKELSLKDQTVDSNQLEGFHHMDVRKEIKNGELWSYEKFFFDSLRCGMQGHCVNGLRQDWWVEFYPSGNLKAHGRYHDDLKEGSWKYYAETGILSSEGVFQNDLKEGYWKFYDETGLIAEEGKFIQGFKDGYWKKYKTGVIESEGKYRKGEPFGEWIYRDGKGEVIRTFDFE